MEPLRFEGSIEKAGPAVRVQSLWHCSPSPDEVDRSLERYWPDDIDGPPLGEDRHYAVVQGIPVEATVWVPDWWVRRAERVANSWTTWIHPPYLDLDEQDDWLE